MQGHAHVELCPQCDLFNCTGHVCFSFRSPLVRLYLQRWFLPLCLHRAVKSPEGDCGGFPLDKQLASRHAGFVLGLVFGLRVFTERQESKNTRPLSAQFMISDMYYPRKICI